MGKLLCMLLLSAPLAAAPLATSPTDLPGTVPDRPTSEITAYNWAAAGTLGPVLAGTALAAFSGGSGGATNLGVSLILVGLGVGPSAGQFYAGSYYHGIAATSLRGLGAVLIVAGASESAIGGCSENSSCHDRGVPIALAGSLAYFGGLAYSLVDTHWVVRRRNSASRVSLAPSLGSTPRGTMQPGLHAQVRF